MIVNCDVDEGWDEGSREGKLNPPVQFKPIVLDGGERKSDGVVIDVFAGLEASGDGVNGVEEEVANPGA